MNNIPDDINIEVLLAYYPQGQLKLKMGGLHKRNSYKDIIETEERYDGTTYITVGRQSLYNSLPEYMFHPIDRFDNLPKYEEKERFKEQIDKQEEEIRKAYLFFAPIDVLLLKLRADTRTAIEPLGSKNIVMQQIIGDNLTEKQRTNRFIKQIIPFLPNCKIIRGNRTLQTMMLRKAFMEEGLKLENKVLTRSFTDEDERYEDQIGMTLGNSYVGNTYNDSIISYDIYYWSDEETIEDFIRFTEDVELLRLFMKDWFMSIEEELTFTIQHDDPPLRLNDDVFHNYLGFNTNI